MATNVNNRLTDGQLLALLAAILAGGSSPGLTPTDVVARYREIAKLLHTAAPKQD